MPFSCLNMTCSVPQKVVRGQALADFLASHPISESLKLHEDIPDEVFEPNMISEDEVWQMFFDGASRTDPEGKISLVWGWYLSYHKILSFLGHFH